MEKAEQLNNSDSIVEHKQKMAVNVPRIKLGKQGLEVSKQGLGCMGMSFMYGPPKPEPEPDMINLIHHAISSGVTFLDTSDVYGPHTNEILLGRVAYFPFSDETYAYFYFFEFWSELVLSSSFIDIW